MSGDGSGDGGGSGNTAGLKETPIDDPFMVYRGVPEYTHVSLPYVQDQVANMTSQEWFSYDYYYRMTSPYDPGQARNLVDLNTDGTGEMRTHAPASSDTTAFKARWFDFYAGIYNFYHVLACRYTVSVENLTNEPLHAYLMFFNDDLPPAGATNQDMACWHGVQHRHLAPVGYGMNTNGFAITNYLAGADNTDTLNIETSDVTGDSYSGASNNMISHPGNKITQFQGVYRPGDFRREIRLDQDVENWTTTSTNPLLPERMLIRLKPDNDAVRTTTAVNAGDNFKARVIVKFEYLVEFKELKTGLRYPVQTQPLTVTINQDPQVTGIP